MNQIAGNDVFVPPKDGEFAGDREFRSPNRPYDLFMEQEGIPIYREIGYRDVRDLELGDWKRTGARGAYVQLLGTEGLWGMYVLEIPAGVELAVERHIYEEIVYVVEGRGITEVWGSSDSSPQSFEWQPGSQFGIPLNAPHRFVNSSRERAILIAGTTAPPVINLFDNSDFVFQNKFTFDERFNESRDYFEYDDLLVPDPVRRRALSTSNFIPDIVNLDLPPDNQRGPGYATNSTTNGQCKVLYEDHGTPGRPVLESALSPRQCGSDLYPRLWIHLHVAAGDRADSVARWSGGPGETGRVHPGGNSGRSSRRWRLGASAFRHRNRALASPRPQRTPNRELCRRRSSRCPRQERELGYLRRGAKHRLLARRSANQSRVRSHARGFRARITDAAGSLRTSCLMWPRKSPLPLFP